MKSTSYSFFRNLIIFISAAFIFAACSKPAKGKEETFKVYGNCEMCKETIEGSLKDKPGIFKADWNTDTKIMKVAYDTAATNTQTIQALIASSGYDTELFKGDDKAYENLHKCCQYKRKQ